jgi:hypothetical protein
VKKWSGRRDLNSFRLFSPMVRFNQVNDVTDAERDLAFANFQKTASHFDIRMKETD